MGGGPTMDGDEFDLALAGGADDRVRVAFVREARRLAGERARQGSSGVAERLRRLAGEVAAPGRPSPELVAGLDIELDEVRHRLTGAWRRNPPA